MSSKAERAGAPGVRYPGAPPGLTSALPVQDKCWRPAIQKSPQRQAGRKSSRKRPTPSTALRGQALLPSMHAWAWWRQKGALHPPTHVRGILLPTVEVRQSGQRDKGVQEVRRGSVGARNPPSHWIATHPAHPREWDSGKEDLQLGLKAALPPPPLKQEDSHHNHASKGQRPWTVNLSEKSQAPDTNTKRTDSG